MESSTVFVRPDARLGVVTSIPILVCLVAPWALLVISSSVPPDALVGAGHGFVAGNLGLDGGFLQGPELSGSFGPRSVRPGGLDPLSSLVRDGVVLSWGPPGTFDSSELEGPSILLDHGVYKMWYDGGSQIGYATSPDGRAWTKQGVVLSPSSGLEAVLVAYPEVIAVGSGYRMWYTASDGSTYRILAASSADGVTWTKDGLVLDVGSAGTMDDFKVWDATVLLRGSTYYMWYTGQSTSDPPRARILLATSGNGLNWTKQGVVLSSGPAGSLDQDYVANPAVRIVGPSFQMIYMGGSGSFQRLFFADSSDGTTWQKQGLALDVVAPDESPLVVQPTFVAEASGDWSVYYAARGTANRIYLATLPAPSGPG